MTSKQLARVSQAVTVKCKQMVESGNIFCAAVLPEFDGNYDFLKQCQNVMHSSKNRHIAKLFTSTKVKPLTNIEVSNTEVTDKDDTDGGDGKDGDNSSRAVTEVIAPLDPVIISVYVPTELESKLSASDWFRGVSNVEPESECRLDDGVFLYGTIHDEFPFKYQDVLVSNSFAMIKKLGLYVEDLEETVLYEFE